MGIRSNSSALGWHYLSIAAILSCFCVFSSITLAQQASATVTGVVSDPTGAAVPNAQITLANVATGVERTTTSNTSGAYAFLNVVPGRYSMRATAPGFTTLTQSDVTLEVNQTATFDFHLQVGEARSTVTVEASAPGVEASTAELGTVVTTRVAEDLPLNGRNFTQLLTITAGSVAINRDQSSGGGSGWAGNAIGSFVFPAINGARNRSNTFLLDGANDLNTIMTTYNYAPIIDAIQEFKTQGHNDLAEYGGVAGGIVSVVTKSGTNDLHGTLWEFLRNEQMDARGFFEKARVPLRQNQYGVAAGGPVIIPKLYNGKNRSFVFASWEGYKQRLTQQVGTLGPTDAMRAGDFSALNVPIYDPATTTYDTATNTYSRKQFAGNVIPQDRINPISALYQSIIPRAGPVINGQNIYLAAKSATNQNSGTIRGDQYFGNSDQVMFRYSEFSQDVALPQGYIGQATYNVYGHNFVARETHTFGPTAVLDAYFGRNFGVTIVASSHEGEDAAFLQKLQDLGMSKTFMTLNDTLYAPQYSAAGYVGLTGSQLQQTGLGDNWQFGGNFSKIWGRHAIKAGADIQTNNFESPIAYSNIGFDVNQTAGLGASQGVGGNAWASLLLGVPISAGYRNIHEVTHDGWTNGFYIQDQWKATERLTINLGFRDDMVIQPIYGSGNGVNFYTGNANPLSGQYILNALPPTCSATQGQPCIPNGIYTSSPTPAQASGLPPHVVVNQDPSGRMIKNSPFNWAGRLGLAYRFSDKLVARAAYGRFYDAWGTVIQLSQNFGGNWPAVATIQNNGLNPNIPNATVQDPLNLGTGGNIIYPPNDFSKVSQWMVDPNFRTPYMDQWNFGIQQQLPSNTVLDVNYVGSVGRHLDWGPVMNVPQPGPGDPAERRPFPYMLPQWFDQSAGNSRYNGLQVTVNKRMTRGMTFLVAYTLSRNIDDGCSLGANCNVSNPYNRAGEQQISDLNQTHVFSASFLLESPWTTSSNRAMKYVVGGWSLNGILQLHSGNPYTVTTTTAILNNGGYNQERADLAGDPSSGPGIRTPEMWFNTAAFKNPAPYTYGGEKPNTLVTDWGRNLDLSLFRRFHVGLGEMRFLEFRAEGFNVFNNVVFGYPHASLTDTNYGRVTSQINRPRELQLGLKFYF